jgi:hypothetical protein
MSPEAREAAPAMGPDTPPPTRTGPWWYAALIGLFLLVFGVVTLSGPGRIDIVDGQTRYEVARSLVEHGDSVIRDPEVWFAVMPGRGGRLYTNYRLPQSVLGVVAIWLADATGPVSEPRRHFFFSLISPFAAAVLAVTYAVWFRSLGYGARASLGWAAAGIFCTPNWYYGTSTFDDMLAASALVLGVALAYGSRTRWPLLGALAAGLVLGWAFNCKQPVAAFALVALALCRDPRSPPRRQLARAGLVLAGLAVGGVVYKLYDWYKFPPGTYDAAKVERTFGEVWTANPLPGLASLIASPAAGALWYCPTLVLSGVGWWQWRRQERRFCAAVLLASLVFVVFLSFLAFFKGDPSWGPRYLTAVFALGWVFVPAGAAVLSRFATLLLLAAGLLVQLLALSVDPIRLYLRYSSPFDIYALDPWVGWDLPNMRIAHLVQRPREIGEIVSEGGKRARAFNPAPYPTFAGRLPPPLLPALASTVGIMALPRGADAGASTLAAGLGPGPWLHWDAECRAARRDYHIFTSLRPWWISQQYLTPGERPVDLGRTAGLLLAVVAAGLALLLVGRRG